MPSNRKRRTRGQKHPMLKSELHLLLTGQCTPLKGNWRDVGESWLRPFILVSPAGRDELRRLWESNKFEIMTAWTGKKLPWAAKEFNHADE